MFRTSVLFLITDKNAPLPASPQRYPPLIGGYDTEFVVPLPDIIQSECIICFSILRDPFHLDTCECGLSFCKSCIEPIFKDKKICPHCKRHFDNIVPSRKLQLTLNDKEVWCTHKKDGCPWKGRLKDLQNHLNVESSDKLDGCQFVVSECIYCKEPVYRKSLFEHRSQLCSKRPYICDHCNDYRSNFLDVTQNHIPVCPLAPIECINNGCGRRIQRKDLQKHIDEDCPETIINCEFDYAGCSSTMPRKSIHDHYTQYLPSHMSLIAKHGRIMEEERKKNDIQKMSKTIAELVKSNDDLSLEMSKMANEHNNVIEELKEKIRSLNQDIVDMGSNLKSMMQELNTSLSKEIESSKQVSSIVLEQACTKIQHDLTSLQEKLNKISRITIPQKIREFRRELEQDNTVMESMNVLSGRMTNLSSTVSHLSESTDVMRMQVAQNSEDMKRIQKQVSKAKSEREAELQSVQKAIDNVYAFSSVTLLSRAKILPIDIVMTDVIVWQVDDKMWISPPFYIDEYKLCLTIYANGDPAMRYKSRGSLSMYIHLLKGENDERLSWPFCCTIKLQLVHPTFGKNWEQKVPFDTDMDRRYNGQVMDNNRAKGWGYASFIGHDRLKEYLINGSLRIQIDSV